MQNDCFPFLWHSVPDRLDYSWVRLCELILTCFRYLSHGIMMIKARRGLKSQPSSQTNTCLVSLKHLQCTTNVLAFVVPFESISPDKSHCETESGWMFGVSSLSSSALVSNLSQSIHNTLLKIIRLNHLNNLLRQFSEACMLYLWHNRSQKLKLVSQFSQSCIVPMALCDTKLCLLWSPQFLKRILFKWWPSKQF